MLFNEQELKSLVAGKSRKLWCPLYLENRINDGAVVTLAGAKKRVGLSREER